MEPKKRGRDTSCAVPGLPDPTALRDYHCERVVLSGLLQEPAQTVRALRELRFVTGDLYHDTHQKLYDVALYVFHGGCEGPLLVEVFDEVRRRGTWLDAFEGRRPFCEFLVDVWFTDLWFADIMKWGDVRDPFWPRAFPAWVALAAAYKVKHLTTRRHAVHAAAEVLRDAMSPVDGIEGLDRRITEFDEEF